MSGNWMRLVVLGAVAGLAPLAVMAQNEPGSTMPEVQGARPGSAASQVSPGARNTRGTMPDASTGTGMGPGGAGGAEGADMRDRMFLQEATEGSNAEIQLGQLASRLGSTEDVRQFGLKMVTDHGQLNESLKVAAKAMGVRLPAGISKVDQAELDKLNGLTGAAFDKEYLAYMVKDHHEDLRSFHLEAATTQDAGLKETVMKGERVIAEHARMVGKLAAANGATAGA